MIDEEKLIDFIQRGYSESEIFALIFGLTDVEYKHALKKVNK